MFRISQALTTDSFWHAGALNTEAESVQSTGLLAIIDFAQTVRTLLEKHMKWREGKTQTHGRGIKADLSKCIMAQVICVYIAAAKFIFYYSRHRINPIDNSVQMCAGIPGVSERHLQG